MPLPSAKQAQRGCWLNTHEHYEELCAVAASGQASEAELADLRAHLDACPTCRSLAYDFTEIGAQGLSALAVERQKRQIPSGMMARFVARARSEGIEISQKTASKLPKRNGFAIFGPIAAVAAIALIVTFLMLGKSKPSVSVAADSPAKHGPVAVSAPRSQPAQPPDAHLQQELASALAEL